MPRRELPRVLVLVGPTASGKTEVALRLAEMLGGEIISADSRQIYTMMDIGTAKPSQADRRRVRHHLVDEIPPDQAFSAGEFGRRGRRIVAEIARRGFVPIVAGGSGLYVRALVDGFFDAPPADPDVRRRLHERLRAEGAGALLAELRSVDPDAASRMLPTNVRRIVRALEVHELTGTPMSRLQQTAVEPAFVPFLAGLAWDRRQLYERINRRVDAMLAQGFLDEVRGLQAAGYSPDLNALQTVGYKEAFAHLEGSVPYDRMVELMKMNTRRFAKRQLTWFRPDRRIRWFRASAADDLPRIAADIAGAFGTEGSDE
jgi:tRNA dimethylallyltransferase